MKKKYFTLTFLILSLISLATYIGAVAYNWGYMQSAIDHHVAAFSAPADVSIFAGIPFIVAAIVFAVISMLIHKRK